MFMRHDSLAGERESVGLFCLGTVYIGTRVELSATLQLMSIRRYALVSGD